MSKTERVHLTGLEHFQNKVCDFFEEAITKTFGKIAKPALNQFQDYK